MIRHSDNNGRIAATDDFADLARTYDDHRRHPGELR